MTKGVTLDLSSSPKRIILGLRAGATSANTTTYTIQELGSYIKEELKLSPLADDDQPFVWEGFNPLQGGNRVGIVFTLNTLWIIDADDFAGPGRHRIKLEQGIVLPEITDEEVLGTPANITWSLAEFTVSSLINQQDFENIKHKLASMSFGGQGGGHAYYWDPINGNDDNDGLSENAPTLSFSAAHTLAQNGGNDTIYLVYIGAGDLIITEQLVITKDTLSVIGPGFHTILDPGITGNTVDIVNADNVLIQGFQVKGDLSAGSNALNLHGRRTRLKDIYISQYQEKGISVHNCIDCRMEDITIQGGVGTGAEDAAFHGHNTKRFLLENVRINDNAGNGVRLIADNPDDTTNCDFRNVDLHANAGYDMSFGTNVSDININPDCDLSGDGLGRIQNQGATGIRDRDASKSLMDLKRYNGIGVKKTISGNTMTITEEDKVTTAQTYSLDSGTSPTIQEDTT